MNTPAHLIFGMAAFGKPDRQLVTLAALAGAITPDLSLYLMAGTHLFILGTPAEVVFRDLYFSDQWQAIFRVDNSFILWGIGLALGLMAKKPVIIAFCAAALLHLAFDFPLHHNDGRAHFWPISTWIFESPVSYWDWRHHGRIVGVIEATLAVCLCIWMFFRFKRVWERVLIVFLGLLEGLPGLLFGLILGPPGG